MEGNAEDYHAAAAVDLDSQSRENRYSLSLVQNPGVNIRRALGSSRTPVFMVSRGERAEKMEC